MAALGRLVARARNAGQLNMMASAKAWAGTSNMTYPASCHHKYSEYDHRAGYATKPRSLLGFFGKDGLFQSREQPRPAAGNDYGVDTRERDDDDSEDEPAARLRHPSSRDKELVSVLPEQVQDPNAAKVTETALDKGTNVATTALDNIGDILTKTGLEVELDVSLEELSIENLVLKDLGLVLVIKTKPQPQPGPPPAPEPRPPPQ